MAKKDSQQLIVEGTDDRHVVWALCKQNGVDQTFSVEVSGGYTEILSSIPVRLKQSDIIAIGLVLDADQDISVRWDAIRHRLHQEGYNNIPAQPAKDGLIINTPDNQRKPRIGVWLMPNNQLPGMIEDFISYLIPNDDLLRPKVEEALKNIEEQNLNRYSTAHRPKAFIHTWLAWQTTPGRPMGQAITARTLDGNAELAQNFVEWMNRLFNP